MPSISEQKKRVVILGGGFGGLYTAIYLEKLLRRKDDFEIVLVNRENYFVFQPMLPEIVSGSIGITDTISPIRRLLPRTSLYVRQVDSVDIAQKTVTLSPGFRPRPLVLPYDHLVVALGNVTDFRNMHGLHEHALPFKNLADAVRLRNHLIHVLEEADIETDVELRRQLLTFVIAGGGFSGVEVAAELNDFVRRAAKTYHRIDPAEIQVVLLHAHDRILDGEVTESLGLYAQNLLQKRGVEIRLKSRLQAASPEGAYLSGGESIKTKTLVSTVPSSPNPLIATLGVPTDHGRIKVDLHLQVEGRSDVWALGDCALVPSPTGKGFCPPTAQFAIREAATLAHNIVAEFRRGVPKTFKFSELGKMGSLGHHSAVAELFGKIRLSGILAWFMWRTVYLGKLPGLDRKISVALAWFLDLLIPPELVQLKVASRDGMAHVHFEPGEVVTHQGDLGDATYMILSGEAEILHDPGDGEVAISRVGPGDTFGAIALLLGEVRPATVRCVAAMDALKLDKGEFNDLITSLPSLRCTMNEMNKAREQFQKAMASRYDKPRMPVTPETPAPESDQTQASGSEQTSAPG